MMRHSLGGIGGHLRNRSESLKSNRSSTDEQRGPGDIPDGDDTTVVEPDQGNVLSHIISQLRPGADLSRVTLPTFILEERSMLERITNFMAHPETLLPMPDIEDPLQRFVAVVKFYLSGWHIKPPGVKKPLNPILGETYTCWWEYPDHTRGYYIAEQTSHHPPKSSYFFMAPEHHIRVDGTLKPRSRFLGNSAASLMEGISYLRFTNRGKSPGGEKYILTQPNMYARGILFGKMKYELGDHSYIRCPENGFMADLEFKTKGYFSGTYNAIGGVIKNDKTGETLYELSGLWSGEMFIKDTKTGQKTQIFNATHAKHTPPLTRPIEEQDERESQRLWLNTVRAVHVMDHEKATDEKAKIEDRQREEAKRREETGEEWLPKLFRRVNPADGEDDLEWIINADINATDPKAIADQILAIAPVLPGQKAGKPPSQQDSTAPLVDSTVSAPAPPAPQGTQSNNLLDFDSPSGNSESKPVAPSPAALASNPMHPTSHPQAPAPLASNNLMDNDHDLSGMNDQMKDMRLQQPMMPDAGKPLKRADTETSEVDEFVDAPQN